MNKDTPPPTLQEQAQAYMDKGHWKRGQHEEIYNAFLAGHAQASGDLREQLDNCKSMWEAEAERRVELEGKVKVATDVLKDIMMRYESGDMACVLANDGLNKIQEKTITSITVVNQGPGHELKVSVDTEGSKGGGC